MAKFEHLSVMPEQVVEALVTDPSGIYVDCTLGGGGHSIKIAEKLNCNAELIGIDQDNEAIEAATQRLKDVACKTKIVHDNFSHLEKILNDCDIDKVDGILFDLGVSSHQIDTPERGFSYMQNAFLDMRMDKSKKFTAHEVVNNYDEESLYKIFHEYGEERFSSRIAKAIVSTRREKTIDTTGELVDIIGKAVPFVNKKSGHPAKRVFQAIRIEVNDELNILEEAIKTAVRHTKTGGRIAVITFHSLEDRIVKSTFKSLAMDCICPKDFPVCVCGHKAQIKILGKVATASAEEIYNNPRSKSAKLRVVEVI